MEFNCQRWVQCFGPSATGLVLISKLSRQNRRQHTWHQYVNKARSRWVETSYSSSTIKLQNKLNYSTILQKCLNLLSRHICVYCTCHHVVSWCHWSMSFHVLRWSTTPAVVNAFYSATKNQISKLNSISIITFDILL